MNKKVVILAAGKSSRFFPFDLVHKSFFRVCGKSILEHTLEDVSKTKPEEMIVVLNEDVKTKEPEILKNIEKFANTTVVYQKEALGMADAILTTKEKLNDDFFVINAQQFNFSDLYKDFINMMRARSCDVVLGYAPTDEPEKYGILNIVDGKICGMVEKPKSQEAPSDKRVLGIYLMSHEFLTQLEREPISEYSLEDTINKVAGKGRVEGVNVKSGIPSLKHPWELLAIKNLILLKLKPGIGKDILLEKTALLKGDHIVIKKGARICDFSIIESPAYIGENALVGAFCQVRAGTCIEDNAQIERYTDVKNSLISQDTHIHSGFIGDSVIGPGGRIGAEFVTANKRLDRSTIKVNVKGEDVDSGLTGLGIIAGSNCKIGIRVSVMPGVVIGNNSVIGPGTIVTKKLPSDYLFYSDLKEGIQKPKNE